MYSPAAIENAPASSPATPDTSTVWPWPPAAPATPKMRHSVRHQPVTGAEHGRAQVAAREAARDAAARSRPPNAASA